MKIFSLIFIFSLFCHSKTNGQYWVNFNDTNSPLLENPRNLVTEDNNGIIWIKSDHTLINYDDGTWHVYDFNTMGLQFQSTVWSINTVVDTLNHLWFLAESYLVEFDGSNFITHDTIGLGQYQIEDMSINRKDNALWFATGLGLVKYLGGTFTRFTTSNSGLTFDEVRDVTIDTNGWVWALVFDPTGYQPVVRFDNTIWWLPFQGIYYNSVWNAPRCIQADNFGNVWWGFEGVLGIRKYLNGVLDSFPNQGVTAILTIGIDRIGNPWIQNTGIPLLVYYYDGSNWVYSNGHDYGITNDCLGVYSFAYDNYGNTWMGTNNGVVVFNPNGLTLQRPKNIHLNQIHLFPTVTDQQINVEGKFKGIKTVIKIFDSSGRLIFEKSQTPNENKFQLDVKFLPDGVYCIQIKLSNNNNFISTKFIKQ